ncbi:MAG: hypothetical protein JXM79_11480 [Sedimentisphaerales bacterium]|nr:hypothetical protein [Sedimentisphaerales bacterium]
MKRFNDYRMRRVLIGFIVSGFLNIVPICSALEYVWTQKSDMPTPRWTHTSAMVGGKIYVIGGLTSQPGERALSTVEEYDPSTNTWARKADMPTARGNMVGSSAVVDGKIYVIGGDDNVSWAWPTVEEYDPATDTWTRKTDMPTSRWGLATCTVNGKIYAIGGAPTSYTGLNAVEQYNPIADTWTRKANMPTGLWGLCAKVVNGKIYAFGGRTGTTAVPNTYEYDPATDTWTRKADMLLPTSQMGSAVLGDKIIVIGGWHISSRFPYTTVQMYDTETDVWTIEGDAPFLRAVFTAEVVNNRIYAIGGTDRPHPCPAFSTAYELTINPPPPDFNGDGVVNIKELLRLIESWGRDDPMVDIAPPPFGDGMVDVLDLELLMSYWEQQVDDPTLIAHWALDETEGAVAYDSAGENDASVSGEPVWQPEGGKVGGALAFDGVDDYAFAPQGFNPADGPFSIFAWIQGGAPGQVVISQLNGADWLSADPASGFLMTALCESGRGGSSLKSESVITGGDWHRIGFVWDGAHRALYVDDILAAESTQKGLGSADGGLNIGCGMNSAPGTFWSSLIDEIRIYDRPLSP